MPQASRARQRAHLSPRNDRRNVPPGGDPGGGAGGEAEISERLARSAAAERGGLQQGVRGEQGRRAGDREGKSQRLQPVRGARSEPRPGQTSTGGARREHGDLLSDSAA